ncbi:MAG: FecR domain-containing protein, partial [Anaerolineales bacterium]|nr:FecR domain-containing protein [Anaerolineales bacterium]
MKTLRIWLAGTGVLLMSACNIAESVTPTVMVDPRSAVVSEFSGAVHGRVTAAEALVPVSVGFTLRPSGEVQTGEASRARLDLSDGTLVRLGALTSFVLQDVTLGESDNVFLKLKMAFGKIWVSLTGGELEVETPLGVAAVRGSFAIIQYLSNDPNNPEDDVLVLDCLEGSCRAVSPIVSAQLGNLERIVIGSQSTLRQPLTEVDVQNFIKENPESARLAATLTAAPTGTATATPTATPTLPPPLPPTDTATATP